MHDVTSWVMRHEGWRSGCLNLIASENVTSSAVRTLLASDLGHRYSLREEAIGGGRNFYMGTRYIEKMLEYGSQIAKNLFGAEHADLRPTSGHACSMAALMSLTRSGDRIMSLGFEDGGYPGYTQRYLPERLDLHVSKIPFDEERMRIDTEACTERIKNLRPRMVVIGPSMITFPSPLQRIAKACSDLRCPLIYDGSHLLGLIAGSAFPNPLREGANMLLGSTHKSFPGPQGGMILSDVEHSSVSRYIPLRVVDNPHFNRIAALIMAMEEMLRFGRKYARQAVANAKALARALDREGVGVLGRKYGYTETHQVLLRRFRGAETLAKRLEEANIIVDSALRLGTCELTRRGMREPEMRQIAGLIARMHHSRGRISLQVKKEVGDLTSRFSKICFAFEAL